jgi:histidine triad (HIT) family protein
MGSDCIFCSIVAGKAPATRVYEDDLTLAFADIFPLERGHLLVVPKTHVENIYELDAELGAHLFRVTVRLAAVMKKALQPDGMNLFQANEVAGGQEVFHFHMHVLPRWKERMPFRIVPNRTMAQRDELEGVFAPVRERLKPGAAAI